MAKRPKMPRDPNELAAKVLRIATGEEPNPKDVPDTRNQAAVALSKLGASKGGKARAQKLTKAQRSAAAKKAAASRWKHRA